MDEYHTCVHTLTDLIVKCGNLWGGPFFELQMAFLNKGSSHKLVSFGDSFFLPNPDLKDIDIFHCFLLTVFACTVFSSSPCFSLFPWKCGWGASLRLLSCIFFSSSPCFFLFPQMCVLAAIKYQLQKKQKNRKHMENIGKIEDFVWTCKGFTKKNQEIQWKNDEFVWKSERCLFEWSKNILSIVF